LPRPLLLIHGARDAYIGPEIAKHSEPLKIRWHRTPDGEPAEPATLVLRVEGPAAIEIQHLSNVIIERVNRFFGWQAVGQIALRQAPLTRRERSAPRQTDTADAARIANTLNESRTWICDRWAASGPPYGAKRNPRYRGCLRAFAVHGTFPGQTQDGS
jgi:hypothetical protein